MEFKGPWRPGQGRPSRGAAPLRNPGPSSGACSSWTTAQCLWLRQGGAAVHAVYSDTILARPRMLFSLSSLQG